MLAFDKTNGMGLSNVHRRTIAGLVVFVFFVMLLRTAWISDDAAITLRTVLNFVGGFGPTFNIEERVQGYTHPLWFLLLSAVAWVVSDPYVSTYSLSIGFSLSVVLLVLFRAGGEFWLALIAACALVFSKAFLDYSTSGLENPLSNFLVAVVALLFVRAERESDFGSSFAFFLFCSLIYLSRPDLLLLVAPFAIFLLWRFRRQPGAAAKAMMLGAFPALAWTAFSLCYYGFPFPNTAYAKLGAGIALDERVIQGFRYLGESILSDPLTLCFISLVVLLAIKGGGLLKATALGIVLYIGYVVTVGGDFMSGRFFTAPLSLAAIAFVRSGINLRWRQVFGFLVLALALLNVNSTLRSGSDYDRRVVSANGIADERGYYFQRTGLLKSSADALPLPEWIAADRKIIVQCGEMGFESIRNGPGAYIIDACALVDPLLARLPAQYDSSWRIGHFYRQLPTNYQRSIASGVNQLSDPELMAYYDAIRLVTRGPLFGGERWRAILQLNFGLLGYSRADDFRYMNIPRDSDTPLVDVKGLLFGGSGVVFDKGIEIALDSGGIVSSIDIDVDYHAYDLYMLFNGDYLEVVSIPAVSKSVSGRKFRVNMERPLKTNRLMLVGGDVPGEYRLNSLMLNLPESSGL